MDLLYTILDMDNGGIVSSPSKKSPVDYPKRTNMEKVKVKIEVELEIKNGKVILPAGTTQPMGFNNLIVEK